MKAIVGLIALVGTPAAGAAMSHGSLHEPTLIMLSGVVLIGIATLLRRYV